MKLYAVIDTNILVSALWSSVKDSPPVKIMLAVNSHRIVPLVHDKILHEYEEVLCRPKFNFPADAVRAVIDRFRKLGLPIVPHPATEIIPDEDDRIFYEVALSARQGAKAYLVTGNTRHFPKQPFVVTPAQMIEIARRA